ncbi:MAG TPA: M50 family metallopeptidase, partial [Micromonosporaceae bacterium]
MAIVETRISVWEALAGRAPGQPLGPADPGLWTAVAERVNPAKARPVLRPGIEASNLVSARGVEYVMLRSPEPRQACYLRLTPDEVRLAHLMDGTRTVARLVAEFARISGRLAPDQVRRVVADLAGNRMLEELPVDAFSPLQRVRRRPWPVRFGRALLGFVQGRRMVVANIDPLITGLYRAGGRLLFTRAAGALMATIAVLGLAAFGWQWWTGEQTVFLTQDSYALGAAVLLGLNILALACHELGHALATKHAGRRVPAAGFLVYFGIPSVFVDTTDVWMAGRRGRLLTTAAGPATGLVLAGASALVGFAVPEAAPWCFKLSFAWYVNALFNLNPFLALDGYYLLMDWLEVPNLRARGLAWVAAQIRRRPPTWSTLDREGRLIALYGMLAVGWLVIAGNVAYRVYLDRVGGLVTGLWRSGWAARVLLVVVVAALMSPVVYVLCGWAARRWRRLRRQLAERREELDGPRRLDALRASSLRDLPADRLAELAAQARWVHPRPGEQLVFAGAAQPEVFAVVDGALEGRAPGDPPGAVRERVGVGGVVGLGAAVTGAPAPLAWYAAGTTLLALPSAALASVVGPAGVRGDEFGQAAEAEALFADAPALAGLSYEDRLGLAAVAVPVSLAPGAAVALRGADDAIVLASGVVATPDGQELGRGTLIGPAGVDAPAPVAVTRTPVRSFGLPAVGGLPLLLGASPGRLLAESAGRAPGRPPSFGVHPVQAYAPLAVPPGPPPPADEQADHRFERRLRWLLVLVLLLALLMTGGNALLAPLAWAEMPTDKALLRAERGTVSAVVSGRPVELRAGEEVYVGESDVVTVQPRARGRLTYRGGASSVLCQGSETAVGQLVSAGEPVVPSAALTVRAGLVLTDTASPSPAFTALRATVYSDAGAAVNQGPAWFAAAPWGVVVSTGQVRLDGALLLPGG